MKVRKFHILWNLENFEKFFTKKNSWNNSKNEKYTSIVAYFRTTQRCTVIDARETAPQKAYRDMYLNDEFGSKYG